MEKFFSQEHLLTLAGTYGIKILGALLIFLIGKKVANILSKMLIKVISKTSMDETTASFFGSFIYVLLLVVVVLAALGAIGIQTTSLVAILGAMCLAVGMALKDSVASIGAGILLVVFKPFKVKDTVDLSGIIGTVESIGVFSTTLITADNKHIIVPNSKIVTDNITNYSTSEIRRVDLVFGIGYEDDLLKAKNVLENIILKCEKILKEPAYNVSVLALAQSSVDISVRVWVKTENYWDVYFYLNENVKLKFDEENINIPYPQLTISNK